MLASLILALHDHTGWGVRQSDGAIGLVDMLATRTTGSIAIFADVLFFDIDLDRIVDFGSDADRGETGLPLSFTIERADADQSVHPFFAFEITVSHRSSNCDRRVIDAGLLIFLAIQKLDRVIVIDRPSGVHAEQHVGPIVGVGPTISGIDRQDGSGRVIGAVEQGLEFEIVQNAFETGPTPRSPRGTTEASSSAISNSTSRSSADRLSSVIGATIALRVLSSVTVR